MAFARSRTIAAYDAYPGSMLEQENLVPRAHTGAAQRIVRQERRTALARCNSADRRVRSRVYSLPWPLPRALGAFHHRENGTATDALARLIW